jgi:hypothetical protein
MGDCGLQSEGHQSCARNGCNEFDLDLVVVGQEMDHDLKYSEVLMFDATALMIGKRWPSNNQS